MSRSNVLYVYKCLATYSDADHIMSMSDIIRKIKLDYGVELDRRTVRSAMHELIDLDIEISEYADNNEGYYLISRIFEKSEAYFLAASIFSSPYVSEEQSKELIKKIANTQRNNDNSFIRKFENFENISSKKGQNYEIFLNIEIIDEAINENKQIEFTYLTYNDKKELVPRRKEPYRVNPYKIIYQNNRYYLYTSYDGSEKFYPFRLDFIKDVEICDNRRQKIDAYKFERKIYKSTNAYLGNDSYVKIRFNKAILNSVIDEFGREIRLEDDGDNYMFAIFMASPEGIKYWALSFLKYVEVLEPQSLRDEISEIIMSNPYKI